MSEPSRPDFDEKIMIGELLFEPQQNQIWVDHQAVVMEPRLVKLLHLLCRRYGHTVSREEIMDEVWEDITVSDISLTRAISELRKITKDNTEQPTIISTVRKVGYRLLIEPKSIIEKPAEIKLERRHWLLGVVVGFGFILSYFAFFPRPDLPHPAFSVIPIATTTATERTASISADGRKIAYVRVAKERFEVLCWDQTTSQTHQLFVWDTEIQYLSWTPSHTALVFAAPVEQKLGIFHVFAKNGAIPTLLAEIDGQNCMGLDCRTETELIASVSTQSREFNLIRLNLLGGDWEIVLKAREGSIGYAHPKWSPDRSKLLLVELGSFFRCSLSIADPDFKQIKAITPGNFPIYDVAWVNDQQVAYLATRTYAPMIYLKNINSTEDYDQVYDGCAFPVALSTSEKQFVVDDTHIDSNIIRVDPTGTWTTLSDTVLIETDSDMAPGRGEMAFVSMRDNRRGIYLSKLDGSQVEALDYPSDNMANPRWSEDEQKLAFLDKSNPQNALMVTDLMGSFEPWHTLPDLDEISCFSDDGEWIYLHLKWQDWKGIARINHRGEVERILDNGWKCVTAGPQKYYYNRLDSNDLFFYDHGQISTVATMSDYVGSSWDLHDQELAFIGSDYQLFRLDLSDPEAKSHIKLPHEGPFFAGNLSLLADGSIYVDITTAYQGDIYLLQAP